MKQFVLPDSYTGQPEIQLSGSSFHYLCTVRRYKPGSTFDAVDRDGRTFAARIESSSRSRCTVSLTMTGRHELESTSITLYQCLPKGAKMDQIVRQGTEAGVRRIVPVLSEHTIPSTDGKAEKKAARWARIAEEAVQQSRAPRVPEIALPIGISAIHSIREDGELALAFDSDAEDALPLHALLSGYSGRVGIFIGPEGGLSENDRRVLRDAGFHPAYLGRQVLRAETAAVYAVAAVQIILLESDQWRIPSE